MTLYAPWNKLVFYYEDYGYNDELIPMGHVESGMELLAEMGEEFTVTMEQMMDEGQETDVSAETTEITMTVGNTVITAELSDSETVRAFLGMLPRTFTMNRYGDREYYGRMESISENGEAITDFEISCGVVLCHFLCGRRTFQSERADPHGESYFGFIHT